MRPCGCTFELTCLLLTNRLSTDHDTSATVRDLRFHSTYRTTDTYDKPTEFATLSIYLHMTMQQYTTSDLAFFNALGGMLGSFSSTSKKRQDPS